MGINQLWFKSSVSSLFLFKIANNALAQRLQSSIAVPISDCIGIPPGRRDIFCAAFPKFWISSRNSGWGNIRKYSHADVLLPLMQIFISSTKIDVATFSSFMLLQEISIYTTQEELHSSSLLASSPFHTYFHIPFLGESSWTVAARSLSLSPEMCSNITLHSCPWPISNGWSSDHNNIISFMTSSKHSSSGWNFRNFPISIFIKKSVCIGFL